MSHFIRKICFFVLFLLSVSANGESLRFKILNSSMGLSQDSIRLITQDKNGLMWFATEDGIVRYDGKNIKIYSNDPDDPDSLVENVATALMVDADNRLWVGTMGNGVTVLDQSDQKFHFLTEPSSSKETDIGDDIEAIYQRHNGEVLISSEKGLFSASPYLKIDKKLLIDGKTLHKSELIRGIWEDKDGMLWVASSQGRLAYWKNNQQWHWIKTKLSNIWLIKQNKKTKEVFLVAGPKGVYKVGVTGDIKPYLSQITKGKKIRDIAFSDHGNIWIATHSGLLRYDVKTKKAVIIHKNSTDENALSSNRLSCLYINRDSTLWVGTDVKGLNYVNLNSYGFLSYGNKKEEVIGADKTKLPDVLADNTIRSIFRDSEGTLWVGHDKGFSLQKRGMAGFVNFDSLGKGKHKVSLKNIGIWSIAEANGYIWLGTWEEKIGLIRYSPKTGNVQLYNNHADEKYRIGASAIRLLLYDKFRDVLWVGSQYKGLYQIALQTGYIKHYSPDPHDKSKLPHTRIRALYLDKTNRLWIGSGGGLSLHLDQSNTFKSIVKTKESNPLSDEDVRDIYQHNDGSFWLATGNGLDHFDPNTFTVKQHYNRTNGLPSSNLYSLIPANNQLWITTINGLSRFNIDTTHPEFVNFFVAHGLQSNEFNFNAGWKDKDGTIFVGGTGGLTKFNPKEMIPSSIRSDLKPVILKIITMDQNFVKHTLRNIEKQSAKKVYQLQANWRNLIIDFALPEFNFPNQIEYEYQLIGFDKKPQRLKGYETSLRYANLVPKKYQFILKKAGDPAEKAIVIQLELHSYFWETLWFKILIVVFFSVTLLISQYLFIKYRNKRKDEKKLAEARNAHYRMVAHDLYPLLHSTIEKIKQLSPLLSDLPKENKLLKGIDNHISQAESYLSQLRHFLQLEGYRKQSKKQYDLEDEVYKGLDTFSNQQFKRINLIIPDTTEVLIYQNSISSIVANLISNALKYSPDTGVIKLKFEVFRCDLLISCQDQGKGIADDIKMHILKPYVRDQGLANKVSGIGLGLSILKYLVDTYQGTIDIKTIPTGGTIFLLKLKGVIQDEETNCFDYR